MNFYDNLIYLQFTNSPGTRTIRRLICTLPMFCPTLDTILIMHELVKYKKKNLFFTMSVREWVL